MLSYLVEGVWHVGNAKVDLDKITVPSEWWTHCLTSVSSIPPIRLKNLRLPGALSP